MNNIFQRLKLGIIKGLLTPTLPDHILKIQNHPLIRILRVLGGLSFLTLLSNKYLNAPLYIIYVTFFIAFVFLIYHIVISYFRIKHIYFLLKSDKLDIKNSPLDRLATLAVKAIMCVKGTCEVAQPVGLTLGLMLGTDEVLKQSGRDPLFAPFLGNTLNQVFPNKNNPNLEVLLNKRLSELNNNSELSKTSDSILNQIEESKIKGGLSNTDYEELRSSILEYKNQTQNRQSQIVSEIQTLLSDKFNKK